MRETDATDTAWMSHAELLTWIEQEGLPVSAWQLERWHKQDLLPRPRRMSLGRGKGTRSEWPASVREQMRLLVELHQSERRVHHLRFSLWLAGYPMPLARLKATLRHLALKPIDSLIQAGVKRGRSVEDAIQDAVALATSERDRTGIRTRMRRHVRNDLEAHALFTATLHLMYSIGPVFSTSAPSPLPDSSSAVDLLIRGMGLSSGDPASGAEVSPLIGSDWHDVGGRLAQFEEQGGFSVAHVTQLLVQATSVQLEQARSDCSSFLTPFRQAAQYFAAIGQQHMLGWGLLPGKKEDLSAVALQVLMMLNLRLTVGNEPLDILIAAIAAAAASNPTTPVDAEGTSDTESASSS